MRTTFLASTLLFAIFTISAQTVPEPPLTPSTNHTSSTYSKSESTYSVNVEGDSSGGNLSISSTNSNSTYKFRARFNKSKTITVRKILLDKLGKENLETNESNYEWVRGQNGNEVFECKLSNGRLRIYVDKEEVPSSFTNEIVALGKQLREVISERSLKESKEREIESAKRALKRAKENLERIRRSY